MPSIEGRALNLAVWRRRKSIYQYANIEAHHYNGTLYIRFDATDWRTNTFTHRPAW